MYRGWRNKMMMVRWICGASLKDRKSNQELLNRLGIICIVEIVWCGRLRWFGHVERKSQDDWVSKCRYLVIDRVRSRGRGRKMRNECVEARIEESRCPGPCSTEKCHCGESV